MLTEIVVTQAVKSALGYGFSKVISAVFEQSQGLSDREILDRVLFALREHGTQIGNLNTRLATLEALVEASIRGSEAARHSSMRALTPQSSSLYCRRCGVVPGASSECPGFRSLGHAWVTMNDVYCRRCGGVPGPSTECPAFRSLGHAWVAREEVYCRRCGAMPGPATECPGFRSLGHAWKRS